MTMFEEQLFWDLNAVFLNPSEFGETHILDGRPMTVVIDSDKLADLKSKAQYADAIYSAEVLLFVKAADLGYKPAVGSHLDLDDDEYQVAQVSGDMLYQIILEAVR